MRDTMAKHVKASGPAEMTKFTCYIGIGSYVSHDEEIIQTGQHHPCCMQGKNSMCQQVSEMACWTNRDHLIIYITRVCVCRLALADFRPGLSRKAARLN